MPTPETLAKAAIKEGLQKRGYRVLRLNSGMVRVKGGVMHLCPTGTPDILAFDRDGVLLWVECKAAFAKKRYDESERKQAEFAEWAKSVGHRYVVAKSMDEVMGAI